MRIKDALKGTLIAVAAAGMFTACGGDENEPTEIQSQTVMCGGVNDCAGKGACGGATHDCAGLNDCAGKGWVEVSAKECTNQGGENLGVAATS
ncbi:MAG: hypothetical protein JRH20_12020 [Deltaproteobacteria bacterium]|nr:hypothetical protein [Deltaproteobacteria bacterium]